MALSARAQRLENSAHDVAIIAIRTGAEASNSEEASYKVFDKRMPFGSSSNVAPWKFTDWRVAFSPSNVAEESNNMPPSMAFSSS